MLVVAKKQHFNSDSKGQTCLNAFLGRYERRKQRKICYIFFENAKSPAYRTGWVRTDGTAGKNYQIARSANVLTAHVLAPAGRVVRHCWVCFRYFAPTVADAAGRVGLKFAPAFWTCSP